MNDSVANIETIGSAHSPSFYILGILSFRFAGVITAFKDNSQLELRRWASMFVNLPWFERYYFEYFEKTG